MLFYRDGDTTAKMDWERSERGEDLKLVYLLSWLGPFLWQHQDNNYNYLSLRVKRLYTKLEEPALI